MAAPKLAQPHTFARRQPEQRRCLQDPASPSRHWVRRTVICHAIFVLALTALVHCGADRSFAAPKGAKPPPAASTAADTTIRDPALLPAPVAEMREAILGAVRSGQIDDLLAAIEWNELPPAFADTPVDDPIAFLREASADGAGREMLAILADLLSAGATRLPIGRDVENADVYVWPYLAERPLDKLSPAEEVELLRLVPAATAAAMRAAKRWTWYRLVIGADGTWHSFMRHD